MVMIIIIHIAHITCLVANAAWHVYDVIGVYNIHHGAGRLSYFAKPAILLLNGRSWVKWGPVTFNGAGNTVVG